MFGAPTEQCEVTHVEDEPVIARQLVAQLVEEGRGHVRDATAHLAGEMLMQRAEVVHGRSVTNVGVRDDSHRFERLEGAVHGSHMHLGMLATDCRGEILGAGVSGGVQQRPHHEPASRRDPATVRTDLLEHGIDVGPGHAVILRNPLRASSVDQ